MKKVISFIIVLSIVLLSTLAIGAFAVESTQEPIAPQASCSHTNYTSSYIYSYDPCGYLYHEVYTTERRRCNDCNDIFYTGNPQVQPSERHSGSATRFVEDDHSGDYTEHTNTFEGTCTKCKGVMRKEEPSGCRPNQCIYYG